MNHETYRNELISRIASYISDREIDSGMVASSYADLIIRYVHANPEDVLSTLDKAIEQKNNDFESVKSTGKRYLALPIADSGIEIRCYFQEKFPSLKFRVSGEKNSFLGLKKERNGENIIVSAGYDDKRKDKGLADFEINNETYTFNPNGTLFSKIQRRTTPKAQNSQRVDITKLPTENAVDEQQLELLNLIYFCMVRNGAKLTANLSVESLDVLFTDFFKQASEMLPLDKELDFYEVMRAVSQLIYFKEELGPSSARMQENGEDISTFKTNNGGRATLVQSANGEPVEVQGKGNENNFYDTVILDENGKPAVKYMFMQTPKGFSIFRHYLSELDDTSKKALTIALHKNQFRISYLSNSPKYIPAVLELRINEDGSIEYEFEETKTLESSGFSKGNAETLQSIIESSTETPPTKI